MTPLNTHSMAKKFATKEAAYNYIDTLPMSTIRGMLADFLTTDTPDKITITDEQFKAFFKIRGKAVDSETGEFIPESRGRKKKVVENYG